MIYKSIPEIQQIFLGSSTAIGKIFNGSDLVFKKEEEDPYYGRYIIFSDPDVKNIMVKRYGDTSIHEITYGQAAAVTTWLEGSMNDPANNRFWSNSYIDSFNEFTYFTGLTEVRGSSFYSCRNMTSVKMPDNVTSIGANAFNGCNKLTSIEIPSTVTYIGNSAFYRCFSLSTVNIPSSVRYIDKGAFGECSILSSSIAIPNSVTEINDYTFDYCYNLPSVTIPNSVTYIGNMAFRDCYSLSGITIPDSVTYIGSYAFDGCKAITSINIPSSVTYIGEYAFVGCDGLTSVSIPSSVTAINEGTFSSCSYLASVTIPNTVTYIGKYAFTVCPLQTVNIPDSVTAIGKMAFVSCTSLTDVTIGNSLTSIDDEAFENCTNLNRVVIPASVTNIGKAVFRLCQNMMSITCKATTPPTLGSNAFTLTNDCPIYVPSASLDAYKSAWSDYASRIRAIPTNISFADNDVKTILVNKYGSNGEITDAQAAAVTTFMSGTNTTNNPLYGNTSVDEFTELAYFTGITAIGNFTFYKCSNMKSVIIPANVTSIGTQAFQQCSGLTSVTIPASVTSLGDRCFQSCSALTSITCEATTPPTLGISVFYSTNNCPIYVPSASLDAYKSAWSDYASRIQAIPTNISFADNDVKTILVNKYGSNGEITEEQAAAVTTFMSGNDSSTNPFYNNTDVDSFDEFAYFTGISAIGNNTFKGCSNMTSITIPENVTSIGSNAFNGCAKLTSINIPNGVTSIRVSTFYQCSGLTSITIPSGVTSIGSTSFSGCSSLTSLTIPASVTSLSNRCFQNCSALTSITCNATTPPTLGTDVFYGTNNCPIYVPAASVAAYKTSWSNYASRIQAIPA